MKKSLFIILLGLFYSNNLFSQWVNTYLNSLSTQTYQFVKYGNTPVRLFTGETEIKIPIYTYKDKDFEIPIYLGYNSSGFIPNRREGIVGLNWYLNAGGAIVRNVNGFPDDHQGLPTSEPPSLHGMYYAAKNNLPISSLTQKELYDIDIHNYIAFTGQNETGLLGISGCETEPDDFTFSMPGHNGQFYIQNNGEAKCMGNNVYKIDFSEFSTQSYGVYESLEDSKITIITDDGYKYIFGGSIQNLEVSFPLNSGEEPNLNFNSVINAWHLIEIVAPNNRRITFSYKIYNEGIPDGHAPLGDNSHYLLNIHHFDGSTYDEYTSDWLGGVISAGSIDQTIFEATKTVYLEKITIDNHITINFNYMRDLNEPSKLFYPNYIGAKFNQHTWRLNSIAVKNNEILLKNFLLGSELLGGSNGKRYFLTSFGEDGSQPYTFSYYNTDLLPDPRTHSIDYWGYWKGEYSMDSYLIPGMVADPSGNGDITYTSNEREPDTSKCRVGLLQKITYPTGGNTTFYYEGHTYSQRLERRNDHNFEPFLYPTSGTAGGARIRKIVDNDGLKNCSIRQFKYTNNFPGNESSGILMYWPRYLFYWKDDGDLYVRKQSDDFGLKLYPDENFLHYEEVTELFLPNNGYANYKYTNYKTNPDVPSPYFKTKIVDPNISSIINSNLYNSFIGITYNNRSFERGVPFDVTQYSYLNGTYRQVKRTTINEFTNLVNYSDYADRYISGIFLTGGLAEAYKIYLFPYLPVKETVTISSPDGGNPITTITQYKYNTKYYLSEKSITQSDGSNQKTTFKHSTDLGLMPLSEYRESLYQNCLVNKAECEENLDACEFGCQIYHMNPDRWEECLAACQCHPCSRNTYLSSEQKTNVTSEGLYNLINSNIIKPLEVLTYKNDNIISGAYYQYDFLENTYAELYKTYELQENSPLSESSLTKVNWQSASGNLIFDSKYKSIEIVDKTDINGNILQYHINNDMNVSILWGYGNIWPIAKIENASYSTIETLLGGTSTVASFCSLPNPTDSQIKDFLEPLYTATELKNSLITTYTFKQLVGMASQTNPNMVKTNYEYDDLERLNIIKNDDGNIMNTFEYNFKQ